MTRTLSFASRIGCSPASLRACVTVLDFTAALLWVRHRGLSVYGEAQTVAVAGTLLALIADSGQNPWGLKSYAEARTLSAYYNLRRPRVLAGIAFLAMAVAVVMVSPGLASILLISAGWLFQTRWASMAGPNPKSLLVGLASRPALLLLALTLPFAGGTESVLSYAGALLGAGMATGAIDEWTARGQCKSLQDSTWVPASRRQRVSLVLNELVAQGYASGDLLLVRVFLGPLAAGAYGLAYRPVNLVLSIIGYQRERWTSAFSSLRRDRGDEFAASVVKRLTLRLALNTGIGSAVACASFVIFQPLRLIVPYGQLSVVSGVLMTSCVGISSSTISYAFLVSVGRPDAMTRPLFIAFFSGVCLNALMLPIWGIGAGAFVTVLVESGVGIWSLVLLLHYSPATSGEPLLNVGA